MPRNYEPKKKPEEVDLDEYIRECKLIIRAVEAALREAEAARDEVDAKKVPIFGMFTFREMVRGAKSITSSFMRSWPHIIEKGKQTNAEPKKVSKLEG